MKVLVTGSSTGIGYAISKLFLDRGFEVVGIDILDDAFNCEKYSHYKQSILDDLPELSDIGIIINNAGISTEGFYGTDDIDVNLKGTIKVTEKYINDSALKSILFIASTSAHNGAEFPEYAASKGGMLAYMKNVANRVAKQKITCNSISPGGVITDMNKHILDDPTLWRAVLDETLLDRWAEVDEIAEWVYMFTVVNKSATGQDLIIDCGELAKTNFVW